MKLLIYVLVLFISSLHGVTVLSTPGVNASNPQIGIDFNGNSVAIWVENGSILSSNSPINGSWGPNTTLSSTGTASVPQLVVDLSGNATAVWIDNGVVTTSSQPSDGFWSEPISISSSGATSPQLAVDSSGNVVAIWIQNGSIESATLVFGGSWPSSPDVLTTSTGYSPNVYIGSNGLVVAVWYETVSSINTIYSSQKTITGTWNTPQAVSGSTTNAINPKIAVDLNGNATAVWFSYQVYNSVYSHVIVQSASLPYNGSWSSPVNISASGCYDPYYLSVDVGVDGSGNVMAFWNNSYDGSTFNYESSTKFMNENWYSPLLMIGSNLYAYSFCLKVDSAGHAVVVYMLNDTTTGNVMVLAAGLSIFAEIQAWSPPDYISVGAYNGFPCGALVSNGFNMYASGVWESYNGTNIEVVALTGIRAVVPPPSNLQITQGSNNFYLFTEYYNTLTWNPSPNPSASYYLIFRNGTVINSTPANVLTYVDPNQIENGPVTYGVAVVGSSRYQSEIITATFP